MYKSSIKCLLLFSIVNLCNAGLYNLDNVMCCNYLRHVTCLFFLSYVIATFSSIHHWYKMMYFNIYIYIYIDESILTTFNEYDVIMSFQFNIFFR